MVHIMNADISPPKHNNISLYVYVCVRMFAQTKQIMLTVYQPLDNTTISWYMEIITGKDINTSVYNMTIDLFPYILYTTRWFIAYILY